MKPSDDGRISATLLRLETVFKALSTDIKEVTGYAEFHDLLHTLEYTVTGALKRVAADFPLSADAKTELNECTIRLADIIMHLRSTAEQCLVHETSWIALLDAALEDLRKAFHDDDSRLLQDVIKRIERQLMLRFPQLNTRLDAAVGRLPLSDLHQDLIKLHHYLASLTDDLQSVQETRSRVEAIDKLTDDLRATVRRLPLWLELDSRLREDIDELPYWLADVGNLGVNIADSYENTVWIASFTAACEQFQRGMESGELVNKARGLRSLRAMAGDGLYRAYTDLSTQCDVLSRAGNAMVSASRDLITPHKVFDVFVCYRREDTQGEAGRLHDKLTARYGADAVFMDIDSIPLAADFVQLVTERISRSRSVIVIIGRNWLTIRDRRRRRRLQNSDDVVRAEVAAALNQKIPVIPVLVQNASMPRAEDLPQDIRELAHRNGTELTHERWKIDVELLLRELDRVVGRDENG